MKDILKTILRMMRAPRNDGGADKTGSSAKAGGAEKAGGHERQTVADGLPAGAIPAHIAIIMDGNGRWAKRRSLPRAIGHKAGAETLKKIARHCKDIGVKHLTAYAFSTENWKRPRDEVNAIISLLKEFMATFDRDPENSKLRVRYIGDLGAFDSDVREGLRQISDKTRGNEDAITLTIALNYGAKAAIVGAARKAAAMASSGELSPDELDEERFEGLLNPDAIPSPDLLIRAGAEKRLSNFLLWELAYAELWFTDVLWPDFSKRDIDDAVRGFAKRQRRFGGIANDSQDH
jgi:undecaprenyl diphosphate synthase